MGKRYFCDYCNRSFLDDSDSRKKHLQGIVHIRARNNHYKQFKDLETVLLEERTKEECKRFRSSGYCQFGDSCNFTHYSKEDLNCLQKEVEDRKKEIYSYPHIAQASLDEWLKTRKSHAVLQSVHKPNEKIIDVYNDSGLPPSLQSPTEESSCQIEFTEWG